MKSQKDPFDIYFCKTKYHAYKILMGLDRPEVENRMVVRSNQDLEFMRNLKGSTANGAEDLAS
jgi:Lon-like ATP-dependent protease